MNAGGRKPKPTHLRLLDGNPGRQPFNKKEPKPHGDLRTPPDWFNADEIAGWEYAISHAPRGMLKRIDRAALVTFVVAENLHAQATQAVHKFGMVTRSPVKNEPMQNPYLSIVNRQAQLMLKASAELGFTPSSRSRVSVPDGPPPEDSDDESPFSEFKRRT